MRRRRPYFDAAPLAPVKIPPVEAVAADLLDLVRTGTRQELLDLMLKRHPHVYARVSAREEVALQVRRVLARGLLTCATCGGRMLPSGGPGRPRKYHPTAECDPNWSQTRRRLAEKAA